MDRHIIPVDEDAPDGAFRLEVGLYRAADRVRLMLTGADTGPTDHLLLSAEVPVESR